MCIIATYCYMVEELLAPPAFYGQGNPLCHSLAKQLPGCCEPRTPFLLLRAH